MPGNRHNRPEGPAGLFERLAGWSIRHRWWALVAWVVVVAGVTAAAQAAGPTYHNDVSLPGTQSQQARDLLVRHAPERSGATVRIVLADRTGLTGTATRARVGDLIGAVRDLDHVVEVRGPYADRSMMSAEGTIGFATVTLDAASEDLPTAAVDRLVDTATSYAGHGLRVELAGDPAAASEDEGGGPAEGLGLLAALVVMTLLFGSVLAAGIPIVIALFAVGSAVGLLELASHVVTVADYTTPLMALVGLGVGIDYSLLLLARYRSELLAGMPAPAAARSALNTAGRTVFVAGTTVILALMGLVVLGLGSLQGVAVAVALTVALTMAAALTLLPGTLALLGGRVARSVRRRAARRPAVDGGRWRAWSALVQRRPWPALLVGVLALLALGLPVLGMRLGFADAGNDPPEQTTRQAYDLLAEGFGPGFNGPLLVVVRAGPDRAMPAATAAREPLARTRGVAAVSPAFAAPDGEVATLAVYPDAKPQAAQTQRLVDHLRNDVLPPLAHRTAARFLVGGTTAATVDFTDAVTARLPWFVLVVVGLSALLLLVVFRSVLVPLKAATLNLLGIGASLGVVTLVFQHGMLGGLLGVTPGPVEAFVPVLIFAIAFGLSMDYEVFLLARMHERWQRDRDPVAAIADGVGTTGRVVTAAGAIMVVVFGSFLLDPSRMLKQFGLGLAVAVLLDAVVVRCLLVPAAMQLFGRWAWWLPAPVARVLPRVALERPAASAAASAAPEPGESSAPVHVAGGRR